MSSTTYHFPTAAEIRAIEVEAHRLRGQTMRRWFRAAFHWMALPDFGPRHTGIDLRP